MDEREEDLFSVSNLPNNKKIHIALDPRLIRTHSGWYERMPGKGTLGAQGLDSAEPL